MIKLNTVLVRILPSLREEVETLAAEDGVTVSQFINVAIAEKIGAMRGADRFLAKRGEKADLDEALRILDQIPERPVPPTDRVFEPEG